MSLYCVLLYSLFLLFTISMSLVLCCSTFLFHSFIFLGPCVHGWCVLLSVPSPSPLFMILMSLYMCCCLLLFYILYSFVYMIPFSFLFMIMRVWYVLRIPSVHDFSHPCMHVLLCICLSVPFHGFSQYLLICHVDVPYALLWCGWYVFALYVIVRRSLQITLFYPLLFGCCIICLHSTFKFLFL